MKKTQRSIISCLVPTKNELHGFYAVYFWCYFVESEWCPVIAMSIIKSCIWDQINFAINFFFLCDFKHRSWENCAVPQQNFNENNAILWKEITYQYGFNFRICPCLLQCPVGRLLLHELVDVLLLLFVHERSRRRNGLVIWGLKMGLVRKEETIEVFCKDSNTGHKH